MEAGYIWSSDSTYVSTDGSSRNSQWNGNNATIWETQNDPCPEGWRIPTLKEIDSLTDAPSKYRKNGYMYGKGKNKLFLPFSGDGYGAYWSSNADGEERAHNLAFFEKMVVLGKVYRRDASNIRCVGAELK